MPESYREPLILFYRQGQSVAEVAAALELSEDAVKQRLSRGRLLLREEMISVVESALARSRPGSAFTVSVLVALPMLSGTTATSSPRREPRPAAARAQLSKRSWQKWGLTAWVGPLIGLLIAYWGTKAVASTARSAEERACILRYTRYGVLVFCFVMIGGLVAVLSQAGKLYTASAVWIVCGVSTWTAALVGGILLICARMDRQIARIRVATNTTDTDRALSVAAAGQPLGARQVLRIADAPASACRYLPWHGGESNSVERRSRVVCGWIAVGDVAVSPLIACGGLAVAPIAMGAISVGIFSLSFLWGVAFGVFALGSLAFGWWAIGCAAAGVKCAVGFAALAREHAVGLVTRETKPGAVGALKWLKTQAMAELGQATVQLLPWLIVASIVIALALRFWRRPQD